MFWRKKGERCWCCIWLFSMEPNVSQYEHDEITETRELIQTSRLTHRKHYICERCSFVQEQKLHVLSWNNNIYVRNFSSAAFLLSFSTHWRIIYVYYYYREWARCVRIFLGSLSSCIFIFLRLNIGCFFFLNTAATVAAVSRITQKIMRKSVREHTQIVRIYIRGYIFLYCVPHTTQFVNTHKLLLAQLLVKIQLIPFHSYERARSEKPRKMSSIRWNKKER